jgi:hypothetical protein
MSTAGPASAATEGGDPAERRVTPLELFFDLVFVFALTQVTGFLADHLTWVGMLQGAASGVVGGILVADQRRASRGGDPCAAGDPNRDGGRGRSFARRPRRLWQVWGALRFSLLRSADLARGAVRARHRQHAGDAPSYRPPSAGLSGRPGPAHRGRVSGQLRPGCAMAAFETMRSREFRRELRAR